MKATGVLLSLITLTVIILPIRGGDGLLRGGDGVVASTGRYQSGGDRLLQDEDTTSPPITEATDAPGNVNANQIDEYEVGDDKYYNDDYDEEAGDSPFDESACFSETTTVKVLHHGNVPMKDLRVGDYVLTANTMYPYQRVYAMAHLEPEQWLDYYQIHSTTAYDNKPLQVSEGHLLYVRNKAGPVRADSIRVGDDLLASSSFVTVTGIERIRAKGLYAPLTTDGNIIVDGIVASSYSDISAKSNEFIEVGGIILPITQADGIHLALSPLRVVCTFSFCKEHNENGMNHYVQNGMDFVLWIEQQNVLLQFVCFTVYLLVTSTSYYAIESLLCGSIQDVLLLFVGIMGVLTCYYYSNNATRNICVRFNFMKTKKV